MPSKEAVRQELLSEFEGIAALGGGSFLDSCAEIGALLSGGLGAGPIDKTLTLLEALMFKVIDDRLTPAVKEKMKESARKDQFGKTANAGAFKPKTNNMRQEISQQTSKLTVTGTDPFSKVLVTALAAFEKDLNYPANKDDTFHPRYVALVSPDNFLGNIAKGAHWKDVGASADHGEFTHRLQWFTIAASDLVPTNTVGMVYRDIGQCGLKAKEGDGFDQKDLWARLCDRPLQRLAKNKIGGAESNNDYRCPENFNTYLRSAKVKFPLLSNFLDARHGKRSTLVDSDAFPSTPLMKDYCAKKLYKVPMYKDLAPPKQLEIDDIVKSGILTVPA
jgi:hypothetical protein